MNEEEEGKNETFAETNKEKKRTEPNRQQLR